MLRRGTRNFGHDDESVSDALLSLEGAAGHWETLFSVAQAPGYVSKHQKPLHAAAEFQAHAAGVRVWVGLQLRGGDRTSTVILTRHPPQSVNPKAVGLR